MADRYWVGGAGTWDNTSTVHWSATSGGAAGASAPTSADNVIFNTLSNATAYAVTIGLTASPAACLDVSIAGPAVGNVTITSAATSIINVHGSWLNAATGVAFASTAGCILNFLATTTGKTVTTNNIAIGALNVTFNSVSGGWTLGSAFNQAGAGISVAAGSFDTGNYAIISSLIISNGSIVRSIALGSSTLTLSNAAPVSSSSVNLTLNAGTSTINCTNANVTFAGSGFTYYNVNFTSATAAINTVSITGANTFNNLNVTTTALQKVITLSANQTVNGTLTLGATNTATFRMSVVSDIVGTPRTLTVATLATLNDVDFRDIVAAGTSSPWSGTRIGNCLGNSNITFTAAATKYWNFAAGGIWNSNAWALTSGGAVAVNNFPLAQDTVIIDDAGLTAGNTINISTNADIGTLDMSTRTTALTLALGSNDPRFYGNVTLCSSLTTTGTSSPSYTFAGQGLANTFNSAGVVLKLNTLSVNCPTGSLALLSNITVELTAGSLGAAILSAGTFNFNGFNLTAVAFNSSNSNTRVLAFGTGKIVLTGSSLTVFSTSTATGLTVTGTAPLVQSTYSGSTGTRNITMGAAGEANAISVEVTAGSDTVAFGTSSGAFKNVDFTGFTGAYSSTNTILCFGSWNWGGVTSNVNTTSMTFGGTSGPYTITSNGHAFPGNVAFTGVGGTWNCADALTLATLTFTGGTLNLAAGTTSTVGSFVTTGTSPKFLGSTTVGTQATISDASGTDTATYLTIQDSNATGGAVWDAVAGTNVDAGNNTGWNFFIPVPTGGGGKKPFIYEKAIDVPTKIVISVNGEIAVRGISSKVRLGWAQVVATQSVTAEARSVRASTKISIVQACQMKNCLVEAGAVYGTTRASRAYVKSIQNLSDDALMLLLLTI